MFKKVSIFILCNVCFLLCCFSLISLTSSGSQSYRNIQYIYFIFAFIFNAVMISAGLIRKKNYYKPVLLLLMIVVFLISTSVITFSNPSKLGTLSSSKLTPIYEEEVKENLYLEIYKGSSDNRYYCNIVHKGLFYFYSGDKYFWDENDISYSSGNVGIRIDKTSLNEKAFFLHCRPLKDKNHRAYYNGEEFKTINGEEFNLSYAFLNRSEATIEVFDEKNIKIYPLWNN